MTDALAAFRLDARRALVTGAASGIGLAIARLFAGAGASLILADRDPGVRAVAEALDGTAFVGDLADPRATDRLVDAAGTVDILVCNAGIAGTPGPMHAMGDAARAALYAVNLDHPIRLTGRLAPRMAERGGGSIVLLSSLAGLRGNAALGHYGITKAALAQLARNLAVEWGPRGVRANAIAPGLIATDWADAVLSSPERSERRLGLTPLRRVGTPAEVAAAALFLASDAGGFVTGHTLVIDGGTLISDGN
ncbi:SDR family NAD(P)-dependent oxidoreductase [Sphingomonas sp. Y38-1Y]|uniref:SDR family NAD(P)-dependent oxidoreductase n=1 Tax=Sphingomonas sp. Y38-1Y TaxID=3078265 RepID=UPI0028E4B015|nr:SDR family oxidoreductase [Sphingomonas sp. Y38-1Y]